MEQHYSNDFNVLRPGKFQVKLQVKLQSCDWRFVLLSQSHKHIVLEQSAFDHIQSWKMQIKDCHQHSSNTYVNSRLFKQMLNIQTEWSLQLLQLLYDFPEKKILLCIQTYKIIWL